MQSLDIRTSPGKGRGVFAAVSFAPGDIIEQSPIIEIPQEEIIHIRRTVIHNYFFKWGTGGALALGYGSLYNHSYEPNALFKLNEGMRTIDFYARSAIKEGEEITVNYNGDPDDRSKLWFQAE